MAVYLVKGEREEKLSESEFTEFSGLKLTTNVTNFHE
jgi:hypothetical protein